MNTPTVAREPYGLQVIDAWRSLGIGIPDQLAKDESLILPVWRHGASMDPLRVRVDKPTYQSYWTASVDDAEVVKAAQSSHAYECILEFAYAEGIYVDHVAPDEFEPVRLWVDGLDMPSLARGVWILHQTCQRLLDFAEGVEIGKPLPAPKFNADAMVKAVTGLTLGPKEAGR
jgi:hypothetical protein